jgi:hypothetical protein
VKEAQALLLDHHDHDAANANNGSGNYFLLPFNSTSLDLVHKQALHMWVCNTSRRQSFNNKNTKTNHQLYAQQQQYQLTFAQLDRVCKQIEKFPTNRQWRLNIGGGWDVMRQGDVLLLIEADVVPIQQQTETNHDDTTCTRIVKWSLLSDNECMKVRTNNDSAKSDDTSSSLLCLSVPKTVLFSDKQQQQQPVFYFSTIDGLEKAPFTPSWRKGHGPSRLKDFLRGQKVVQRHSRVIYFRKQPTHSSNSGTTSADFDSDNDKTIAAVWVPTKAKWITDALFTEIDEDQDDPDSFAKILLNVTSSWV